MHIHIFLVFFWRSDGLRDIKTTTSTNFIFVVLYNIYIYMHIHKSVFWRSDGLRDMKTTTSTIFTTASTLHGCARRRCVTATSKSTKIACASGRCILTRILYVFDVSEWCMCLTNIVHITYLRCISQKLSNPLDLANLPTSLTGDTSR